MVTVQAAVLRNKGLLYIILWIARSLVGVFTVVIFVNKNPLCEFLNFGCIEPNLGFLDYVGFTFVILSGLWIMSGSKFAIWAAGAYVTVITILDVFGLLLDPFNGIKIIFDFVVLYILLRK